MSWISFFGFSGWPAANAGHTASHLPHCTQASKPSSWFQVKSVGFSTPSGALGSSRSSALRPVERPPPKRSARRCQARCRAPAKACFIGPPQVMPRKSSDTPQATPMARMPARNQPPKPSGRMPAAGRVAMKKLAANISRLFGRRIHGPLDRRDGGSRRRLATKRAPTNISTVAASRAKPRIRLCRPKPCTAIASTADSTKPPAVATWVLDMYLSRSTTWCRSTR
ncbi:hypothetical protein D9M72_378410 [compost metagenome]